jgi:hypothetical protein
LESENLVGPDGSADLPEGIPLELINLFRLALNAPESIIQAHQERTEATLGESQMHIESLEDTNNAVSNLITHAVNLCDGLNHLKRQIDAKISEVKRRMLTVQRMSINRPSDHPISESIRQQVVDGEDVDHP